jgi:hypothetical protein
MDIGHCSLWFDEGVMGGSSHRTRMDLALRLAPTTSAEAKRSKSSLSIKSSFFKPALVERSLQGKRNPRTLAAAPDC